MPPSPRCKPPGRPAPRQPSNPAASLRTHQTPCASPAHRFRVQLYIPRSDEQCTTRLLCVFVVIYPQIKRAGTRILARFFMSDPYLLPRRIQPGAHKDQSSMTLLACSNITAMLHRSKPGRISVFYGLENAREALSMRAPTFRSSTSHRRAPQVAQNSGISLPNQDRQAAKQRPPRYLNRGGRFRSRPASQASKPQRGGPASQEPKPRCGGPASQEPQCGVA